MYQAIWLILVQLPYSRQNWRNKQVFICNLKNPLSNTPTLLLFSVYTPLAQERALQSTRLPISPKPSSIFSAATQKRDHRNFFFLRYLETAQVGLAHRGVPVHLIELNITAAGHLRTLLLDEKRGRRRPCEAICGPSEYYSVYYPAVHGTPRRTLLENDADEFWFEASRRRHHRSIPQQKTAEPYKQIDSN